jgi:hypothetical protein
MNFLSSRLSRFDFVFLGTRLIYSKSFLRNSQQNGIDVLAHIQRRVIWKFHSFGPYWYLR